MAARPEHVHRIKVHNVPWEQLGNLVALPRLTRLPVLHRPREHKRTATV